MINGLVNAAIELQDIAQRLTVLRARFESANPSVAGTALQGQVTAINGWINSVVSVANSPVIDAMIKHAVATHQGKAL